MARPRKSEERARALEPERRRVADDDERRRELEMDQLVRLVAARVRETLDPRDPAHDRYFDWLAAESRAALTPEERLTLAAESRQFARALLARRVARDEPALVRGAPAERPAPASRGADAVREASHVGCAPRFDLAVAAGVGRELWDEPAASWVELPADVPAGQHVALTVKGDSMEPMLHAGDTILVRLGAAATVGDVVVARRPEDGHVVKRVAAVTAERLVLASLNTGYDDVVVPHAPGVVVGTVVLRWCRH